jgi:hypothetical protein
MAPSDESAVMKLAGPTRRRALAVTEEKKPRGQRFELV